MATYNFAALIFENRNDDKLKEIIKHKHPEIFDDIYSQLKELIKLKNPTVDLSEKDYKSKIEAHLNHTPLSDYGAWVYYDWSNRLVHLLPKEEFILVRTNRNQYKITPEERDILATKKIGIIGLSVGQSIALTIAMERAVGELRLADFDLLELSNLNRLRAGVHNLGIPKAVISAREIAEIDPFLKIVCFNDGLTAENMDDFFTRDGKLDLLIDECDGLDIKILCRFKARELGIPVIMDTNDKGMMDIERFDLEPQRDILHGLAGDLNPEKIGGLTNEQKIPYILRMVGIDTISPRLKASMMEIKQTIATWPQLASAVALGGALGADVSRRILLNQLEVSGRFYIDMEELIANKPVKLDPDLYTPINEPPVKGIKFFASLKQKAIAIIQQPVDVEKNILTTILKAACHAPSAGNMQPWRWVWNNKTLFLYHDVGCSYSFLDYNNLGSCIGFGSALENLKIKSNEFSLLPHIQFFSDNKEDLVAAIQFEKKAMEKDQLLNNIFIRVTNRKVEQKTKIAATHIAIIQAELAPFKNIKIKWIDSEKDLATAAEIVTTTDRIRILHPQGHYDLFMKELRWNKQQTLETADGIDIETMEMSLSDQAALKLAADEKAISYLRNWEKGNAFTQISAKAITNSAAIGLIYSTDTSKVNYINAGSALQRAWIKANALGYAFQPMTASLFMFQRMLHENSGSFNPNARQLLFNMYEKNNTLWQLSNAETAIFMFKLHHAGPPTAKALRKLIDQLFYYNR